LIRFDLIDEKAMGKALAEHWRLALGWRADCIASSIKITKYRSWNRIMRMLSTSSVTYETIQKSDMKAAILCISYVYQNHTLVP